MMVGYVRGLCIYSVFLLSLLLVAGCVEPKCEKPYILVGDDCCLDENGDGICDRDKPVTTTSRPKAPKRTTTTSTASTSSSSTTSTTSTLMKVRYTTTTTSTTMKGYEFTGIFDRTSNRSQATTSTTSTTLPKCVDSDGGRKYNIRSLNVSGNLWQNDTYVSGIQEYCIGSKRLMEYYCASGRVKSLVQDCQNRCEAGRCCLAASSRCESDKDCCSRACRPLGMVYYCM